MNLFFFQLSAYLADIEEVDLWLVAGQSNTDGRVSLSTERPSWLPSGYLVPNTQLFNRVTGQFEDWEYLRNSGGSNNADQRWAYDSTAIYKQAINTGRTQYVIKNSLGGTSIGLNPPSGGGQWNVDYDSVSRPLLKELEERYALAMKMLAHSRKRGVVRGILWHQGESDSNSQQNKDDYYQNLTNVIAKVRSFTNTPDLPFIFGSIPLNSGQFSPEVNTAHFQIASEDQNAHIVDMGSGSTFDGLHFDGPTSEFLGDEMASIMAGLT